MAGTFDMLRANDLIFNYVVSNWLMGQDPPAFDILAWNADSTRMPAAMHAFYLRNFYVENKLAAGELEIAGTAHRPERRSRRRRYMVSAINDHIVPWRSSYRTADLVSGPVRFVLGSGGHIAGIVNPPGPKAWYLVGDRRRLPASRRGLARRRRAAQGLVVGGLGAVVGRELRPDAGSAADGQRRAPGAGRRARGVRPDLTAGVVSEQSRSPAVAPPAAGIGETRASTGGVRAWRQVRTTRTADSSASTSACSGRWPTCPCAAWRI